MGGGSIGGGSIGGGPRELELATFEGFDTAPPPPPREPPLSVSRLTADGGDGWGHNDDGDGWGDSWGDDDGWDVDEPASSDRRPSKSAKD